MSYYRTSTGQYGSGEGSEYGAHRGGQVRGRRPHHHRPPRTSGGPAHSFRCGEIVKLNVGGRQFTTSRTTLSWINDTFFTGLLSNRIPVVLDEHGAVFIDRDPDLFSVILNFLRTKNINLDNVNINSLLHEAEYFGITPLVRRITVCLGLDRSKCGNLLFHGLLQPVSGAAGDLSPAVLCRRNKQPYGRQVTHVVGSHNYIAVSYPNSIACYKLGEFSEWKMEFTSPLLSYHIDLLAVNARVPVTGPNSKEVLIAIGSGSKIYLWSLSAKKEVGCFDLEVRVEALIFIATGLVALSSSGVIGVWNTMTHNWKVQAVQPITSYDVAGCTLILGCGDGCIYSVDMAKFPLRMKDNDLLVSKLYSDPERNKSIAISAISVYLTPKQCIGQQCGEWIEIAYGTNTGMVRVIFQHPETVGQGPQVLQSFHVHRSPVTRVSLSENHLISVCSESNHVRSWTVTRFRGRILTQPSSTPLASFNIISLDEPYQALAGAINTIGPHSDQDDSAVFLQKVVQNSNEMFVTLASTGKRLCALRSVDNTNITAYSIHDCDSSTRTRMRRYILTGHENGCIQMWDLTTAFERDREMAPVPSSASSTGGTLESGDVSCSGITQDELLRLMNHCDLQASLSTCTSPFASSLSLNFNRANESDDDNRDSSPCSSRSFYDNRGRSRRSLPSDFTVSIPGPHIAHTTSGLSSRDQGVTSPSSTPVNSDDEAGHALNRRSYTLPRQRPL